MSFARWENFEGCTLEQMKLGHDKESADKICRAIQARAEKGMLYKAADISLEVLSKAGDPDLVVGGYASWETVDDEGETITVEAQSKGLQRFFAQAPEYQSITVNHREFKLAQPQLKYVDSKGAEYFSHVNEKGTYLISKIRDDKMVTTQYYREQVRKGNIYGYSISGLPLDKDSSGKEIRDIEYHAITLCERGKVRVVNPKTANVVQISKAGEDTVKADLTSEEILQKYGFNKTVEREKTRFLGR
jgi:hypothetical protein